MAQEINTMNGQPKYPWKPEIIAAAKEAVRIGQAILDGKCVKETVGKTAECSIGNKIHGSLNFNFFVPARYTFEIVEPAYRPFTQAELLLWLGKKVINKAMPIYDLEITALHKSGKAHVVYRETDNNWNYKTPEQLLKEYTGPNGEVLGVLITE